MGVSLETDKKWMTRVLALARLGGQKVSPNPKVGSIIVKGERILAEAFHERFGGPHAEILALQKVKSRSLLSKATMYVNLEPCVHFGKTPPCLPIVQKSGIRRIVIGMEDPNPLVSGRGVSELRRSGLDISVGVLRDACEALNERFVKNMRTGLPWVTVKIAMSLDGKIATKTGESKWITSKESRSLVKKLRANHDAILVGKNTVLLDNPALRAFRRDPFRIILDPTLETPLSAKVYRDRNAIVIVTPQAPRQKREALQKRGIITKIFDKNGGLHPLLRWLYCEKNIGSLLVEGGSETFGLFFDEKLVDKVYFFIAPKIIGGRLAKSAVSGEGVQSLHQALRISEWKIRPSGPDFLIEGKIT